MIHLAPRLVLATCLLVGLPAGSAAALQIRGPGDLGGRVVDSETGEAIVGARVVLMPSGRGLFPPDDAARAAVSGARAAITDGAGGYRFGNVPPGGYRLFVRRIGYQPVALDLELEGPQAFELSVGLAVAPIRLQPLATTEQPADLYSERTADSLAWDRLARERWRQNTFAETDVRVVAEADVEDAVTLGERDVMRALRRFPGVSGRDDWTAEPWIRGAPEGHTRVYFDEIPVFNPVHAGGLTASIDPDALSAVFLHPGLRPPILSEGVAAVVDLRSRSAGARNELPTRISATSTRLGGSLSHRWMNGRIGAVLTASRSWLQSRRNLARTTDGFEREIPNDFADLVFRTDVALSPEVILETSGLWQRDWFDGFLEGGPANNSASWGSHLGRVTLQFPIGSGTFRQTIGVSGFNAQVDQIEERTPLAAFDPLPTQEPTDNDLVLVTARGEWVDTHPDAPGVRWRLGYELGNYEVSYHGAPPTPYSILTYLYTLHLNEDRFFTRLWLERWWHLGDRWLARVGIRREEYGGVSRTFYEPYGTLRWDVSTRMRLSLSTGRHIQFAEPLAPAGLLFGPALSTGSVWLLAPNAGQVLVSDVTTLGAEYWMADEWLGTVHVYGRETDGIAMRDPVPGSTDDDRFLVDGHNDAWGTEISLRKLAGKWTGSFAYTLGFATYSADRMEFPAPTDRRHVLDLAAATTVADNVGGGSVHMSGTFTAASGAPYTRIHPGWYDCRNYEPGGHCEAIVPTSVEEPNAERAPWTTGTNVRFEWSRSFEGWRLGLHAQMQNVFNTPRAMTYSVDESCRRQTATDPFCGDAQDTFLPGLRRHIDVGVRVVF